MSRAPHRQRERFFRRAVGIALLAVAGAACLGPPPARGPRPAWRWSAADQPPRTRPAPRRRDPAARVAQLAARLSAADCLLRVDAARALAGLGDGARAAIPQLVVYVKDATCDIAPAVQALRGLRAELAAHIPGLIDCMEADTNEGSWACADLLAALGAPALPYLEQLVADPPSMRRNLAVYALGRLGSPALPQLLALLPQLCAQPAPARGSATQGADPFRNQVVDALGAVGGPALHRIRELWNAGAGRRDRRCLVWLLTEMVAAHSAPDPRAQQLIEELLRAAARERDPALRRPAESALRALAAQAEESSLQQPGDQRVRSP